MFFVQGTGSSVIGTYELAGVRCANCNAPGAMAVTVFSRYAHLFWIPLFPFPGLMQGRVRDKVPAELRGGKTRRFAELACRT
ncbi:hypothetical protein GCM10027422_27510 [Hymenobacter arcticus]